MSRNQLIFHRPTRPLTSWKVAEYDTDRFRHLISSRHIVLKHRRWFIKVVLLKFQQTLAKKRVLALGCCCRCCCRVNHCLSFIFYTIHQVAAQKGRGERTIGFVLILLTVKLQNPLSFPFVWNFFEILWKGVDFLFISHHRFVNLNWKYVLL